MGTYFMSNRCTDKVMIPKYIHIYNGIVVDYLKKKYKDILRFPTPWMTPKIIMLTEIRSQTEEGKYCMISFICVTKNQ